MSKIQVYNKSTTDFSKNGRVLKDTLSCYVTRELNGSIYLEMEHPKDELGKYFELQPWNIVQADGQLFRIPFTQKIQIGAPVIKVKANHIFYDLIADFIEDRRATDATVQTALTTAVEINPKFTVGQCADLGTNTAYFVRKNPVQAVFTILDRWGGELHRDNFTIAIKERIGQDGGYLASYGKNIVGFEETQDLSEIATRIMPIGKDGLTIDLVNGGNKYLDSPRINDYPFPITKEVKFEDIEDATQLKAAGEALWGTIDRPKTNYKIDFQELKNTDEYSNYAHLQGVELGDTVTIRHKIFGTDIKQRVIKTKKNVLLDKLEEIELGDFKKDLADSLNNLTTDYEVVNEELKTTKTQVFQNSEQIALKASKTEVEAVQSNLENFVNNTYNPVIQDIQNQIDGSITTWFKDGVPTLTNAPAVDWNTNELKNIHLGDLYYDNLTGYAYRFRLNGSTYEWLRITDTDVTRALQDAQKAQDTADGKRRVFVTTPAPPYDVGDLWTQGTSGDLMRCKTARATGSYNASDWEKASKYTDDTAVNNLNTNEIVPLKTRVSEAEQKITPEAIVDTVMTSIEYTDDLGQKVSKEELGTEIRQRATDVRIAVGQIGGNNLLKNSNADFESRHWLKSHGTDVSIDNTIGYKDGSSFKVVANSSSSRYLCTNGDVNVAFKLKPNQKYTLSGWIKTSAITGSGAKIFVTARKGTTTWLGDYSSEKITGTKDWTYVSLTFTTPSDCTHGNFYCFTHEGTGTAWFDELKLEDGENATAWSPHGSELKTMTATFDDDGLVIEKGAYRLIDDGGVEYLVTPNQNLINDHSFELLTPSGNIDATHNDYLINCPTTAEGNFFQWRKLGSPRLISDYNNGYPLGRAIFGLNAVASASGNYIDQRIALPGDGGGNYTISTHAYPHPTRNASGKTVRSYVYYQILDFNGTQISSGTNILTLTTNHSSTSARANMKRHAFTINVPANAVLLRLVFYSPATDEWVIHDGVQCVKGERPVFYMPEDSLWALCRGYGDIQLIEPIIRSKMTFDNDNYRNHIALLRQGYQFEITPSISNNGELNFVAVNGTRYNFDNDIYINGTLVSKNGHTHPAGEANELYCQSYGRYTKLYRGYRTVSVTGGTTTDWTLSIGFNASSGRWVTICIDDDAPAQVDWSIKSYSTNSVVCSIYSGYSQSITISWIALIG